MGIYKRIGLRLVHRVIKPEAESVCAASAAREVIKRKSQLRWWLVYGPPPRTGTSYLLKLIKFCSILYVSDWGLGPVLDSVPDWLENRSSPDFNYIKFDYNRFRHGSKTQRVRFTLSI